MEPQIDAQALDVLRFMQRNGANRALFYDLVSQDIERWREMDASSKLQAFNRNARRFAALCPTLAQKDRVKHAAEALRFAAHPMARA